MSEHKTLLEALAAFQAEAPTLKKDATNPHFKSRFASLDNIVETIKPLLAKHGLVWTTLPGKEGDNSVLRYRLFLATAPRDDALAGTMPLLLTKQDPQGQGSAITYARRYALCAVLNLVADEDDDGNAGSQKQTVARIQGNGPVTTKAKMTYGSGGVVGTSNSEIAKLRGQLKAYADKGLRPERVRIKLAAIGFTEPYEKVTEALPKLSSEQASGLVAWLGEQIEAA